MTRYIIPIVSTIATMNPFVYPFSYPNQLISLISTGFGSYQLVSFEASEKIIQVCMMLAISEQPCRKVIILQVLIQKIDA